ncbi:hypothetical protein [Nocardioides plantarum]|uniref:Cell division protein FtsL n=1 Tax=Nocardioides plantarum TaxID=29299 RepID=A0ABV5KES9_9ACTN|nr:hypothetical protein [Nocardioides plantarum]
MSSTAPQRRSDQVRTRTSSSPTSSPTSSPAGPARGRVRLAAVPRLRSRAPRVPFVALVSLLLLAGVVGLLLFNTSLQQASFTAQRLQDQSDVLTAREQALSTELDRLRSPARLEALACKLGMVIGSSAGVIDVRTGKVVGKPVAAPKDTTPCADPDLTGQP